MTEKRSSPLRDSLALAKLTGDIATYQVAVHRSPNVCYEDA